MSKFLNLTLAFSILASSYGCVGKQPQPKNGDVTFMYNSDGLTRCDMYYDGQYFTGYAKWIFIHHQIKSQVIVPKIIIKSIIGCHL